MLMQKHREKVKKAAGPISLAQVNTEVEVEELLQPVVKKGKASVRAPTDPNKLKLVQLNNEKPPKKSKPAASKLLQVDSNVVVGTDSSASAKLNA